MTFDLPSLLSRVFALEPGARQQDVSRPVFWGAFALIVVAGTVLRFWELSSVSLWRDEAITLGFARLDLWTILTRNIDNHPPLTWVIQHFWHAINPDPAAARVPAATAGSIAVAVFMLALRDLAGARTAIIGGLLLAFSTAHIHYSQDARMYPYVILGLILAAWGALGHAQPGRLSERTYAVLYVAGAAFAIYSHITALIAMAVISFGALYVGTRGEGDRAFARAWFIRNVVLFVLVLPWLVLIPSAMGTFPGLSPAEPILIHWFYRNVAAFPGLGTIGRPFEVALLVMAILSVPVAWLSGKRALAAFFLALLVIYPLIVLGLHLRPDQQILSNRSMMPVLIGVAAAAGFSLSMVRSRRLGTALAAILVATAFASALSGLRHNVKLDDYGGALEYADTQGFGDAPVVTCDHFSAAAIWENRRTARIYDYRGGDVIHYKGPGYWQAARMSMVKLRPATAEQVDAELGGGWKVPGGLPAILEDEPRVAVMNVWCGEWEQDIFDELETLGFVQRGEQHRARGKAGDHTILQDPEARVILFERIP